MIEKNNIVIDNLLIIGCKVNFFTKENVFEN